MQSDAAGTLGGDPPALRTRFDPAAWPAITRADEVAATLAHALEDERFRDAVGRADAARDRGDWPVAEAEYGRALRLHPLHWGYTIQFAHAAKEQDLFVRAEAWYRSAVALGAPADMVDEHLAFVARANGVPFVREADPDLAVAPLCAPPTVADIHLMAQWLGIRWPEADADLVDLLRGCPTCRDVLLLLIARGETLRGSRAFFEVLHG